MGRGATNSANRIQNHRFRRPSVTPFIGYAVGCVAERRLMVAQGFIAEGPCRVHVSRVAERRLRLSPIVLFVIPLHAVATRRIRFSTSMCTRR
jgi:hypothetical protein